MDISLQSMAPIVTPGDGAVVDMQLADLHCWAQVWSLMLNRAKLAMHGAQDNLPLNPEGFKRHELLAWLLIWRTSCRQGRLMSRS